MARTRSTYYWCMYSPMSIHLSRIDIIYRYLQVHMVVIHSTYVIQPFHFTPPLIYRHHCSPMQHAVLLPWDFESHELLTSFDQSAASSLVLSPDARQLTCTPYHNPGPPKIYIRDIPPDILTSIWPAQEAPSVCIPLHISTPTSHPLQPLTDQRT
jgi:hypothetical protein